MKVLAIMGSPRKGDSYQVTRRVESKLREYDALDFEYIFLKDTQIEPCQGCFQCVAKGEEYCPLRDDCPTILEKMLAADGVIFVSPVHALSVSTLMKAFKDRLAYNAHRPRFFGKYALFIATSSGTGLDGALGYLSTFSLWGFEITGKLGLVRYPFLQPTERLETQDETQITKAALKFYKAMKEKKPSPPTRDQVLQFHVLKCNTLAAGDYWQADREFYKDKSDYFYETSIPLQYKISGWIFERFYWKFMRQNYRLDPS